MVSYEGYKIVEIWALKNRKKNVNDHEKWNYVKNYF